MKVILLKDHEQLGEEGTITDVAPGYARNFLFPKKVATMATDHHVLEFNLAREKKLRLKEKETIKARKLADKLSETSCTITVAAGEGDTLYGSVTDATIAEALSRDGFQIDKSQVELENHIKKLGIYSVTINTEEGVSAQVKIWIVKE